MTFINRHKQLLNTIKSISKYNYSNFDIVIVDDCSDEEIDKNLLIQTLNKGDKIHIIKTDKEEKNWTNPVIVLNKGIEYALNNLKPDIIVTQNAEAYYLGDVLNYINDNLTQDNYITMGCFGLDENVWMEYKDNMDDIIEEVEKYNNSKIMDERLLYYNHKTFKPTYLDYCGAITVENMVKLNGFDERYFDKKFYGDSDFLLRINRIGLNLIITDFSKEPIVIHQWHNHFYFGDKVFNTNETIGYSLYSNIVSNESNNIEGKHLITPNFKELVKKRTSIILNYDEINRYKLYNSIKYILKNYDSSNFYMDIIINNISNDDININNLQNKMQFFNIHIINNYDKITQHLLYNNIDNIIFQKYNCIHVNNLLEYSYLKTNNNIIINYGCLFQSENILNNYSINIFNDDTYLNYNDDNFNHYFLFDEKLNSIWYKHPIHNNTDDFYCISISVKNFIKHKEDIINYTIKGIDIKKYITEYPHNPITYLL